MAARGPILGIFLVAFAFLAGGATAHASSFVTFETGQVRPLALSPDDTHLYALNTPDDRLETLTSTRRGISRTPVPSPSASSRSPPPPTVTGGTSGWSTTSRTA